MLRWGRRYRHVSEALVVLSMIMNGMGSASRSAWPLLQNEGLHRLPRPLCWLPALLPPSRRAFLLAAAASSAWSCFLFFWLPDYAVSGQIWITSMLVIAVTLRISCRPKGRRHLKLCSIPGLPRKSEKPVSADVIMIHVITITVFSLQDSFVIFQEVASW